MQYNVKYLMAFEPHYSPDTNLGVALMRGQESGFCNESLGVPITYEQFCLAQSHSRKGNGAYPFLLGDTTAQDYEEACFVRRCKSCTYGDLDRYRLGDTSTSNDYGSGYLMSQAPGSTT